MEKKRLFEVCDNKTPKKQKFLDFLITIGLCTLGISLTCFCGFIKRIDTPLLQTPVDVYGEMTDPSLVRLILIFIDTIFVVLFFYLSLRFNKKERLNFTTFFSYMAGCFLWQLVGECVWHFGAFRIEAAPSLPIVILLCALFAYLDSKKVLSWPVLVIILAFMSNWLGHLCMLGPAQILINYIPERTSYIIFGSISCVLFFGYCLYRFIFRTTNVKERMYYSMGIFISVATIIIAFIEGLK